MTNDPSSENREDLDLVASQEEAMQQSGGTSSESLSPWLVAAFLGIMFLGTGYLFWNSGGFQANVFNPAQVAWDGSGTGGAAAAPDPMVIGKKVFNKTCAVCHQGDGLGVDGQFPPLAGSAWVMSKDWHGDNHAVKIVLNGLQGPVTVEGKQYNNAMAPWGNVLKDDEIAAVLTYVRNSWGNEAPPITAEFVAQIREQTGDRRDPWTEKELRAIEKVLIGASAPASEAPATDEAAPAADAAAPEPATQP